jgi:hypothetical protein
MSMLPPLEQPDLVADTVGVRDSSSTGGRHLAGADADGGSPERSGPVKTRILAPVLDEGLGDPDDLFSRTGFRPVAPVEEVAEEGRSNGEGAGGPHAESPAEPRAPMEPAVAPRRPDDDVCPKNPKWLSKFTC